MRKKGTDEYIGELTSALLLEALKAVKEDSTLRCYSIGICCAVEHFFMRKGIQLQECDGNTLRSIMRKWPKYSGRSYYPIPAVTEPDPYFEYHKHADLWSKKTEYGRLRWELLEFCIKVLTPNNL